MNPASLYARVLTKPETLARVRLSDSTISRLEEKGLFPSRVKLGLRKVGWRISDIEAWEAGLTSSTTDVRPASAQA